jgi:hypothetical protein
LREHYKQVQTDLIQLREVVDELKK